MVFTNIYYNIKHIDNIDSSLINITLGIFMLYKNDKSSTLIEYSELTKNKFINILSNNMNLLKVVLIDNLKKYDFFVNPILLLDFINNNNGYSNIRYYFNKKIYIDLDSNIGIQLINKCNEFYPSLIQLYIQPIIIIKLNNNNNKLIKNNDYIVNFNNFNKLNLPS